MMGHDILFDWENGRVGIAESSCEYLPDMVPESEVVNVSGLGRDCAIGNLGVSQQCADSIDLAQCQIDNMTDIVQGFERWSVVTLDPNTPGGKPCEAALLECFFRPNEVYVNPVVYCEPDGLCHYERPCQMTCEEAKAAKAQDLIPEKEDDDFYAFNPCGEPLWGSCEFSCQQTKIITTRMSDGVCHEDEQLRETRACHIDACGRSDPCRVPFLVHAVLGFQKANADFWSNEAHDEFSDAFAKALNKNKQQGDELIGPGDVKVLSTSTWFQGDDPSGPPIGMKVTVEVSIYNDKAWLPPDYVYDPITEEEAEVLSESPTASTSSAKDAMQHIVDNVKSVWKDWTKPMALCEESDVLALSRDALDVHLELGREQFLLDMILILARGYAQHAQHSHGTPFAPLFRDTENGEQSKVISSWTIKSEIDGGTLHDHPVPALRGIKKGTFIAYLSNVPFMIVVLSLCLFVCCCGCSCGSRWAVRSRESKQLSHLLRIVEMRREEQEKGEYAQVGANCNGFSEGFDDSEDEQEMDFAQDGEFRDEPLDAEGGDLELAQISTYG